MGRKIQVRLHQNAKSDWKSLLAALPGNLEDKDRLVRVYSGCLGKANSAKTEDYFPRVHEDLGMPI